MTAALRLVVQSALEDCQLLGETFDDAELQRHAGKLLSMLHATGGYEDNPPAQVKLIENIIGWLEHAAQLALMHELGQASRSLWNAAELARSRLRLAA